MKKLLKMFLAIFLIFTVALFAGELSSFSILVKERMPVVYNHIEDAAQEKWGSDYEMVIYFINKQCKDFITVVEYSVEIHKDKHLVLLLYDAIQKWSEKTADEEKLFTAAFVNWSMVVYTYEKQKKAYYELKGGR